MPITRARRVRSQRPARWAKISGWTAFVSPFPAGSIWLPVAFGRTGSSETRALGRSDAGSRRLRWWGRLDLLGRRGDLRRAVASIPRDRLELLAPQDLLDL